MIKITDLSNSTFEVSDVVSLLHEAFAVHINNGLNYLAADITEQQFKNKTANAIAFVAYDTTNNKLVGTGSAEIKIDDEGCKYLYVFHNGIKPECKRMGVGSLILHECEKYAIENDCQYLLSDTSTKATSAVNYHLKNGFKIIGLISHPTTNYYSYVFRKQFVHPSPFDEDSFCKRAYFKSMLMTKFTYTKYGNKTLLYRILYKTYCLIEHHDR